MNDHEIETSNGGNGVPEPRKYDSSVPSGDSKKNMHYVNCRTDLKDLINATRLDGPFISHSDSTEKNGSVAEETRTQQRAAAIRPVLADSRVKQAIILGGITAILLTGSAAVVSVSYLSEFPGKGNLFTWLQAMQISRQADALATTGKVSAAMGKYKEAVAIYADDSDIYRKAAEVLAFESYQWNDAEKLIRQALLHNDKDADSMALLAYIQYRSGQKTEAKESIRRAVDLNSSDQKIQCLRGLVLTSLGDGTGEQIAEDAFRKSRNDAQIARILSLLFLNEAKDLNRAEELAKEAVRLSPNNADLQDHLAAALIAKEKFEAAEDALKEAAHIEPDNAVRWSKLGKFLLDRRREKDATAFFQMAADLDDKNAVRFFELGNALRRANRSADAIPVLKKAVAMAPDEVAYKIELADAYFFAKNYQSAAELFGELVKVNPGNTYSWEGLGWSQTNLENNKVARDAFLECVRREPKNASYCNGLALVDSKLGYFKEGSDWILYSLSINPDLDDNWRTVIRLAKDMQRNGLNQDASTLLWKALKYSSKSPVRNEVQQMYWN